MTAEAATPAGQGCRRPGADRPSEAADREAQARSLRAALRTQRPPARPTRAAARGAGSLGDRGRTRRRECGRQDHERCSLHPQAALAQAVPRASAARAGDRSRADSLPLLWRRTPVEAGRGRHRDPGGHSPPVEGDPDVREKFSCRDCESINQAPAPFHVDPQRLGRPQPAGDDPVREVRPASAAQPPGRALRPRRRAA